MNRYVELMERKTDWMSLGVPLSEMKSQWERHAWAKKPEWVRAKIEDLYNVDDFKPEAKIEQYTGTARTIAAPKKKRKKKKKT